jgi:hypothetical protein
MNIEEIKRKLSDLDTKIVKDFILDLYTHVPDLHLQIETLILRNDPAAFAKAISKRIQSVKRGRKFIDYYASYSFARGLESITRDIETGLLESSPELAFGLVDKFLATAEKVLERCDDSNGDISGVYSDATLLWLTTASSWSNSKENWLERIYQLNQQNDYGVLDSLLPNSHLLLSNEQLNQLAWRYESELKMAMKAPTENGEFNLLTLKPSVALHSIAEALKDPELYEKATLINSPKPNDLQKKGIAKMYLQFEQVDKALEWLSSPWDSRFSGDRLRLLDKAHLINGDYENLKQVRYQLYQMLYEYDDFKRYLDILDDTEKQAAREEAIKIAEQAKTFSTDVAMLFALDEAEIAQNLVLNNPIDASNCYYSHLLEFAKQFEIALLPLAEVACYRSLLLDILARAKSKSYGHAVKYYRRLTQLDIEIEDYMVLETHEYFQEQLQLEHGRKKSFWARLD